MKNTILGMAVVAGMLMIGKSVQAGDCGNGGAVDFSNLLATGMAEAAQASRELSSSTTSPYRPVSDGDFERVENFFRSPYNSYGYDDDFRPARSVTRTTTTTHFQPINDGDFDMVRETWRRMNE